MVCQDAIFPADPSQDTCPAADVLQDQPPAEGAGLGGDEPPMMWSVPPAPRPAPHARPAEHGLVPLRLPQDGAGSPYPSTSWGRRRGTVGGESPTTPLQAAAHPLLPGVEAAGPQHFFPPYDVTDPTWTRAATALRIRPTDGSDVDSSCDPHRRGLELDHPSVGARPMHAPLLGGDDAAAIDANYSMGGHLVLRDESPQEEGPPPPLRSPVPPLPQNADRAYPPVPTPAAPPLPNHTNYPGGTTTGGKTYDVTDPQLFWLNDRPYLLQRSVGKGGFGEVHRVEMMLPLGMEVGRDASNSVVLDEEGRVRVHQTKTPEESPVVDVGERSRGNRTESDAALEEALQLSEAAPDSMKFYDDREEIKGTGCAF